MNIVEAVPIKEYLELVYRLSFEKIARGQWRTNSPFSSDSTPSFIVYEATNSFYCFSTGTGGNIINFVSRVEGISNRDAAFLVRNNWEQNKNRTINEAWSKKVLRQEHRQLHSDAPFDQKKFINQDEKECREIEEYANSRGLKEGYEKAFVFQRHPKEDGFVRVPSLMFLHRDENNNVCGAKFRKLPKYLLPKDGRYTARGKLSYYLLESNTNAGWAAPQLYVVEGEINANSLLTGLRNLLPNFSGTVMSLGGVSTVPKHLPTKYTNLKPKIIIDYDGNEELYQERLEKYKHLDGHPIKLHLPKGEDINSLYVKNQFNLITNLLLK